MFASPDRQYWQRPSFVSNNDSNDIASLDLANINEDGITIPDLSGNGKTGIIVGGLLPAFSSVGRGLRFQGDGNIDWNSVASEISPNIGYLEMVVQIFDASGSQYFFSSNSNVRDHIWITSGSLQYQRGNPGVSIVAGAPTLRSICHFVGQYNNGNMEFFVDGASIGTNTFTDTSQATLASIGDFRNTGVSRVVNSNILYARRGNVNLSVAEIQTRYNAVARTVLFHETWEIASVTTNITAGNTLGGTNWYVESGTWKISESGDWKGPECVSDGTIFYLGVDDTDLWTVANFVQEAGSPTLNRLIDRLEIDGTTGDKVGEVLLTVG